MTHLDAGVLHDVCVLLIETVPAPCEERLENLPPLDPDEDKRIFRPTAAHPRAYRGTHDRPRKHRGPERIDLRCYVMSSMNRNRVLARLRTHWLEARDLLQAEGYLEGVLREFEIPEDGNINLFWSYHSLEPASAPMPMSREFAALNLPAIVSWAPFHIHGILDSWRLLDCENQWRSKKQSGN